MKTKIFLFISVCLTLSVFSQQDSADFKFVQFFYADGKISSEGYLRENKPDGFWKTYHENGLLKSEGNRKDFLLDGIWKFYDLEGKLTLEISYLNNIKNGKRVTYLEDEYIVETFVNDIKQGYTYHYFPDHRKKKEILFVDGLEEGMMKEYDEEGIVITLYQYRKGFIVSREIINRYNTLKNKHGLWMEFYETGELKRTEEWRNGILNGFVKEFEKNGNLKSIEKFVNGEVQIQAEELKQYDIRYDYYADGKIKIMGSYHNDLPDGVRREYDESGKIIRGYIFREGFMVAEGIIDEKGLKQGPFIEYHENGRVKAEGRYRDSKPVGPWKYYYLDGILEQEGTFDSRGRQIEEWIWYYQTGSVWRKENYIEGLLEGEYEEYDISSKLIVKGQYFDGEETGKWFWEIGDVREDGNYVEGQYSGNWKITDLETGKIIFEGKYLDGYPNGKHSQFWPNGQKRREGHYVMGKREGEWIYYDLEGRIMLKISYKNGIEQRYDNVVIQPIIED